MRPPESPLYRLLRRQSMFFVAVAVLASGLMVLWGASLEKDEPLWARFAIVIGSSGLGTCLGLVFGGLSGASALQRVTEVIETTLVSALHAPDGELQAFRAVWHHYLVTKVDGRPVWRYRRLDFARTAVPGKLIATLTVPRPDGHPRTYTIEAFILAPRIVFVQQADVGAEPPVIHVYPFATEHLQSVIAGVAFLQTWGREPVCSRAFMCHAPVPLAGGVPAEGTLDARHFATLDEIWKKHAAPIGLPAGGCV